ncbi:MAG: hypothetical protein DYG89_16200 [Caldilinea sp. CFX5]|nr:hypothetical protein [Caldilinea sp. CFX5]
MAETDDPLKRLFHTSIKDIAAWLLEAEVVDAQTVNIELPGGEPVRADHLFRVLLATGRTALLHIEFQGRSSRKPMKWRMLDYITRVVEAERELDLYSVVFYVGEGVGARDTGEHEIKAPDGSNTLRWKYRVVHLWKLKAEELLALARPGLLPLIGQTQMSNVDALVPDVVTQLKAVEDQELQGRLFTTLVALVDDERILAMLEKLIDSEEFVVDTPYLRRVRAERAAARVEVARLTRQQDILNIIVLRLNPPIITYRELEKAITAIEDDTALEQLFVAAVQTDTLDNFLTKIKLYQADE